MSADGLSAACAPFDPAGLPEADDGTLVAFMHPADFLRLTCPVCDRIDSAGRTDMVRRLLEDGVPLSSFPELALDVEGHEAFVQAHEGRHRAMEIMAHGGTLLPVVLTIGGWGQPSAETASLPGGIRIFHPQPHDGYDSYPGLDEEDLEARLEPMDAGMVLVAVLTVADLRAALLTRTGPG